MSKYLDSAVKKAVIQVMEKKPRARDGGMHLVLCVWAKQMPELLPHLQAIQSAFKAGQISKIGSIDRCRRKVEEEFPSLRGATYDKRQRKSKRVSKEMMEKTNAPTQGIPKQETIGFRDPKFS